jgi:hypothetical protein
VPREGTTISARLPLQANEPADAGAPPSPQLVEEVS